MVAYFNHGNTPKLPKSIHAKIGNIWTPAQKLFVRHAGNWQIHYQNEVVVTLGNTVNVVLKQLFTPAQWADASLKKRVIVPSGVEIGSTTGSYAIVTTISVEGQAASFAGELTLDIYGTVSGIGGQPNSGVGGSVIWGNFPGREGQKLTVNNFGLLRAGGGAGGRGGNGGNGVWYSGRTLTEGPTFNPQQTFVVYGNGFREFWWGGVKIGPTTTNPSVSQGGWTYYMGAQYSGSQYHIYRQTTVYDAPNYTSGGTGGNGGRGQGYDAPLSAGSAPVAGGTNAGASGKSGDGGPYGSSGQAGATGASGNSTGGLAGADGGPSGFYLHGSANVTLNNSGTLLGRLS